MVHIIRLFCTRATFRQSYLVQLLCNYIRDFLPLASFRVLWSICENRPRRAPMLKISKYRATLYYRIATAKVSNFLHIPKILVFSLF